MSVDLKSQAEFISKENVDNIIETTKPLGLFYTFDTDKWIGIDNSSGDVFIEEFDSFIECYLWLVDYDVFQEFQSIEDDLRYEGKIKREKSISEQLNEERLAQAEKCLLEEGRLIGVTQREYAAWLVSELKQLKKENRELKQKLSIV